MLYASVARVVRAAWKVFRSWFDDVVARLRPYLDWIRRMREAQARNRPGTVIPGRSRGASWTVELAGRVGPVAGPGRIVAGPPPWWSAAMATRHCRG